VINAVTRSGTNSFHGGAFGYVRNKAFNARNYFATEPDALDRRQYGGYLGGPVKLPGYDGTNRTFFFVGWQGTLLKNTTAQRPCSRRPTISGTATLRRAERRATSDYRPGHTTAVPGQSDSRLAFRSGGRETDEYFARVDGTGQHQVSRASAMDFNQVVVKVDHQVTNERPTQRPVFIDHFDNAAIMTPGDLLSYRIGSPKSRVRTQSGVFAWKKTLSSTALTESHVGFQRMHAGRVTPDTQAFRSSAFGSRCIPTTPNLQSISVDGYFAVGADAPSDFVRNGVEFNNRTNWAKGKHSIQFGAEASGTRRRSTASTACQARSPSAAAPRATPWPISCWATCGPSIRAPASTRTTRTSTRRRSSRTTTRFIRGCH
jgi:hypothetical protein